MRFERIWDAYLFALAVFAVEAIASRSVRGLAALAALVLLPVAVFAGAFAESLVASRDPRVRIASAVLGGSIAGATAWMLLGRSVGATLGALATIFTAGISALGCASLGPRLARALERASAFGRALSIFVGAAALVAFIERSGAGLGDAVARAWLGALAGVGAGLASLALAGSRTQRRLAPALGFALKFSRPVLALALFSAGAMRANAALPTVRALVAKSTAAPSGGVVTALVITVIDAIEPAEAAKPKETAPPPPAPPPGLAGRDLILVTIDALRADHVGAYGYERSTSPAIDALASEGAVFDSAFAATSITSFSLASILTGKFMRPLAAMELGADSTTLADRLHARGYSTTAIVPLSLFTEDEALLAPLIDRRFGFDRLDDAETSSATGRAATLASYLASQPSDRPVFAWVHLSEPRAPYQPSRDLASLGARDLDRYDGEITLADRGVAEIVRAARARPNGAAIVVISSSGEEFGEHDGRYHGSSVYEEQTRVAFIVSAPGVVAPRRVGEAVSAVDLVPTVLGALRAEPAASDVRGRDLSALLVGDPPAESLDPTSAAFADTDDMALLATGKLRLVCLRRAGSCALYDLDADPQEKQNLAATRPEELSRLRARLRAIEREHGRRERAGKVDPGAALPEALQLGLAGDGDAAVEVGRYLLDPDVTIRRTAAQILFDLKRPDALPALRAAVVREEPDPTVRAYVALALQRLGDGAPYVNELLVGRDLALSRLAALALAESGDDRGEEVLLVWWMAAFPPKGSRRPARADVLAFDRAREVIDALATMPSDIAVGVLLAGLRSDALRPHVARALAKIHRKAARPSLAEWLAVEPLVTNRVILTEALLTLGAGPELRDPLVSMLGMPDPLPKGVDYAIRSKMLRHVGGPTRDAELDRLQRLATSGVLVDFYIPELPDDATAPGGAPVRAVCRATAPHGGEIWLGRREDIPTGSEQKGPVPKKRPSLDEDASLVLSIPRGAGTVEVFGDVPAKTGARPGKPVSLVVYATQGVHVEACLLVPKRTEFDRSVLRPHAQP
ncbi:MAG: sulfatase-like hydrolase/transferase [Polyangiaceae bacterium]